MLEKLIDDPYWDEFPDYLRLAMNQCEYCHSYHYEEISYLLSYLFSPEAQSRYPALTREGFNNLSQSEQENYKSFSELTTFWSERFFEIKAHLIINIQDIIAEIAMDHDEPEQDDLYAKILHSLNRENNLNLLKLKRDHLFKLMDKAWFDSLLVVKKEMQI